MKRCIPLLLAALVLWTGAVAHAAYTGPARVESLDESLSQPGTFIVRMRFTGNAGEIDRILDYTINGSTTQAMVQDWIFRKQAELNTARTISRLAALQPGQLIPPQQATTPALSAFQQWQQKANQLVRLKEAQDAGVTIDATALANLKTAANAAYQVGFEAQF